MGFSALAGPQLQVSTVIAAACGALAPSSAEVLDAVRVEDGRYWSYLEEDPAIRSEGIALDPGHLDADPVRATTDADGTTATPAGHADAPAHDEAASETQPPTGHTGPPK
ncbi:MAG: hypothetical protein JWP48_3687 [Actinoallomurus sp.]|nr:hypothetical protein [Actinoallomurus sp.]